MEYISLRLQKITDKYKEMPNEKKQIFKEYLNGKDYFNTDDILFFFFHKGIGTNDVIQKALQDYDKTKINSKEFYVFTYLFEALIDFLENEYNNKYNNEKKHNKKYNIFQWLSKKLKLKPCRTSRN